jgi:hypothetical protein
MIAKIFEVRDDGSHIQVFALSTSPSNTGQAYGLERCGFRGGDAVIVGYLDGERPSSADPYFWGDRTMTAAHDYITLHFGKMHDGDVVDVRHILGETTAPCKSDREHAWGVEA